MLPQGGTRSLPRAGRGLAAAVSVVLSLALCAGTAAAASPPTARAWPATTTSDVALNTCPASDEAVCGNNPKWCCPAGQSACCAYDPPGDDDSSSIWLTCYSCVAKHSASGASTQGPVWLQAGRQARGACLPALSQPHPLLLWCSHNTCALPPPLSDALQIQVPEQHARRRDMPEHTV